MKNIILPLVDWLMGTYIIIGFAVFCVVLIAIVYNMVNSKKPDVTIPKEENAVSTIDKNTSL